MTYASDEDRKNHERMQALIDQLQSKIKSYKKQIEEAEEIAALNLAKFRQAQGQLADASERADINEQALAKTKAKVRGASVGPLVILSLFETMYHTFNNFYSFLVNGQPMVCLVIFSCQNTLFWNTLELKITYSSFQRPQTAINECYMQSNQCNLFIYLRKMFYHFLKSQ